MLKYLLAATGFGFLIYEGYNFLKLKNKKNNLLQKIYKVGDTVDIDGEYICEYTFDDESDCHKVIIETYKIQNNDLIQNSKISFVHIIGTFFKENSNYDSKEQFSDIQYRTQYYYKEDGKNILKLKYDLDLEKIIDDYNLIKISTGSKVGKIYFYCKRINRKIITLLFSNDLDTLIKNIDKNKLNFYYYIILLSFIVALTTRKIALKNIQLY